MPSPAGTPLLASLPGHQPALRRQPATPRDPWSVGIQAPQRDPPPAHPGQTTDRIAPAADRPGRRALPGWLDRSTAFLTQQLVAAEPEPASPAPPPVHRIYHQQLAQRLGFAGPLAPLDLTV